jgi:hypothetical protein
VHRHMEAGVLRWKWVCARGRPLRRCQRGKQPLAVVTSRILFFFFPLGATPSFLLRGRRYFGEGQRSGARSGKYVEPQGVAADRAGTLLSQRRH